MSSKQDRWKIENLRLGRSLIGAAKPRPKPTYRGRVHGLFIRGPVPVAWIAVAGKLGVSVLLFGNALWYLCGRNYNKLTFSVSNVSLAEFGLSRQAKYRALEALERAGLIKAHRSGKRSISVTLLCAAGETPEAILNRKQEVNVVKR